VSTAWLWIAAAGCALSAWLVFHLDRRLRPRPRVAEGEPAPWAPPGQNPFPGALTAVLAVAAANFAATGLWRIGTDLKLWQQIALAAIFPVLAVAAMLLDRSSEPRKPWNMVILLLWTVYVGWVIFDLIHYQPDHQGMTPLIGALGFAAWLLWFLIRNWHDEDALSEEFDPREGYRRRRSAMPVRVRAVLMLGFTIAMLAAIFFLTAQTWLHAAPGGAS
jgi:hypothetical protein